MAKITNLSPKFPLISKDEEIIVGEIQSLGDFVGGQSINTPTVVQQNYLESANFVTGSAGWKIDAEGNVEFNAGTFRGTLTAGELHIPDQDATADSFHINSSGDAWWGATETNFNANNDNATAYVLKTGAAVFKSIQVGGSTVQYTMNDSGIFSFGDGSDGALTTSGNVTLTEDKYYTDLTISAGDIFNPAGYRIFVSGTLTLNGTIRRNGNAGGNGGNASGITGGSAGTGGAALSDGYLKGSPAGKAGQAGGSGSTGWGGSGVAGVAGAATSNSIGSNGVAGGDGGKNAGAVEVPGGTGGIAGVATPSNVKLIANWHLVTLLDIGSTGATVKFDNSAGSGSGGSGAGSRHSGVSRDGGGGGGSGGSGSSGGIIAIYARKIVINSGGVIEANGGNGGNGGNGASSATDWGGQGGGGGGGAAGNGGQIILAYNVLTNNGSIAASAGTGGTGGTGGAAFGQYGAGQNGAAGSDGNAGTIYQFQLSL